MLKKARYILLAGIVLAALLVVVMLFIDDYVARSGSRYIISPADAPKADAIIVLGAKVAPDGTPSEILADRLDIGLELYKANRAQKIIVSGDHGRTNYDEVNAMRKYLQAKGAPREDIFMDHAGFDTYDSMYRARDIFLVKKAIVVTQEFHLVRALYIARKLGIEAYSVTSDIHFYPELKYLQVRELGSRFKAFLQADIFIPKPKILGKAIPLAESGAVTDNGK